MDYIYSKLNSKLIDSRVEQEITWTAYDTLPEPSEEYYMTVGVVNENNADNVYLCIKKRNKYVWKLVVKGAVGELDAPVVTLNGTVIQWTDSLSSIGYEVYANNSLLTFTTENQLDIEFILTELGTYQIYVIAKASTGSGYEDSAPSNAVSYEVYNKYFKFVSENELVAIPNSAEHGAIPIDFKTNGLLVNYKTVGEQYEFFAYPATFGRLVDVEQSGQHVLGNYIKLENTVRGGVEYHLYRTTLPQIYDDSDYIYRVFRIE